MNEEILRQAGMGKMVDAVKAGLCPTCRKPIKKKDLRDDLSKREFDISGMCQECQDSVFLGPDDE
jgi:RNase P subunit RPR2